MTPAPDDGMSSDLQGFLVLPSLEEHHAHLDKALTADRIVNETGDLRGAIQAWIEAEKDGRFDIEEMTGRAERAIEALLGSGVTRVRTHVNIGESDSDLRNLRAVDSARRRFTGSTEVEIVALMHSPMTGEAGRGNRATLEKALEYGIDLIGGCPHLEPNPTEMIRFVVETAASAGCGIDLHVDETLDPGMLTLQPLARIVIEQGFDHSVTASHCVSLSVQTLEDQHRLADLLGESRIRVVALPQTNLFLQGRESPQGMPRAIAPARLLLEHGVRFAAGGDNVQDPFNPMGRSDPLDTAALLVVACHLDPLDALDAVTTRPVGRNGTAAALIGKPADFLAIDALNVREALAGGSMNRSTVRRGRVVSESRVTRRLTTADND